MATRAEQIDALERKERDLIERIRQTQANQNALIQRQVQEVSKPRRSTNNILESVGYDLDRMDPLAHEIEDIVATKQGRIPTIHQSGWKR